MLSLREVASLLDINTSDVKAQLSSIPQAKNPKEEPGRIPPTVMAELLKQQGKKFPRGRVVTFASLKGGIGKTTLTLNVAVHTGNLGAKVLVIDLDPEACATNSLLPEGVEASECLSFFDILKSAQTNLQPAIQRTKYPQIDLVASSLINHQAEKFLHQANPKKVIRERLKHLDYNFIFLELPPSFTTLTASAYLAADLIVLPCTPDIYAYESIALTIEAIDELVDEFECAPKTYRILMNQFNMQRVASQNVKQALFESYPQQLLPSLIKDSAEIANATNAGLSVFEARTSGETRRTFHELTKAVWNLSEGHL